MTILEIQPFPILVSQNIPKKHEKTTIRQPKESTVPPRSRTCGNDNGLGIRFATVDRSARLLLEFEAACAQGHVSESLRYRSKYAMLLQKQWAARLVGKRAFHCWRRSMTYAVRKLQALLAFSWKLQAVLKATIAELGSFATICGAQAASIVGF
jgi:hypothetical protein